MPPVRPFVRRLIRIVVSATLLGGLLAWIGPKDLGVTLLAVDPWWLGLGTGLFLVGQVLSAVKWWVVGSGVGLARPLGEYLRYYFIGMFVNLFGPSTLGGDTARSLYLGGGQRPGLAAATVVFDRGIGLVLLVVIGAVALVAFPRWPMPTPLVALMVTTGVALVVGWLAAPILVRVLPAGQRVRRWVEHDLAALWHDRGLLARVVALALLIHGIQIVVQYILVRAAGASVPIAYCLVYHPVLSIATAVPVSLAGFGIREGGYVWFLGRVGIEAPVALVVGLLWFLGAVLGGLAGSIVFLVQGGELPRFRRVPPALAEASGPGSSPSARERP